MQLFLLLLILISSTTASPSANATRFVAFGDYGTGSTLQKACATAINAFCDEFPVHALLGLGDNFYNGPLNVSDPRWYKEFTAEYTFSADMFQCAGMFPRGQ